MTTPTTENERRGSEMWTGGKTCCLEWGITALCLGWDGMAALGLGSGGGTVFGLAPAIWALDVEIGTEALLGPAIGSGMFVGPEAVIAALCLGTAIAALCLATAVAFGGGDVESVRLLGCEPEPSATDPDVGDNELVATLSVGAETTSLMLEIGGSDATPTSLGNSCFRA